MSDTGTNLPAHISLRLDAMERDIRNLYRMRDTGEDPRGTDEIVFSLSGKLFASTSPRYYFSPAGVVRSIAASIGAAAATDVVVVTRRNGVGIQTVTIPAGSTFVRFPTALSFSSDTDYLTFSVTSTGGASDLSVIARYSVTRPWRLVEV